MRSVAGRVRSWFANAILTLSDSFCSIATADLFQVEDTVQEWQGVYNDEDDFDAANDGEDLNGFIVGDDVED